VPAELVAQVLIILLRCLKVVYHFGSELLEPVELAGVEGPKDPADFVRFLVL
jgi:hypothetical protein